MTLSQDFLETLVSQFRTPSVKAIILKGSYARDTADEFSDVDLLRLATKIDSNVDCVKKL